MLLAAVTRLSQGVGMKCPMFCLVVIPFTLVSLPAGAWGQDPAPAAASAPAEATPAPGPLPGHSYHGETFNEGPRQSAVLLEGMGNISFPVTTANEDAQRFISQGVAQLHGFWYYESERSFRQAAALDPECAMAYW